jgi:peptidoglycan/LPS O-acetylase OafA/YrhL
MCLGNFSQENRYKAWYIALQSISLFILIVSKNTPKKTMFGRDFIKDIANLSFMIYLIHPFFLDLVKTELDYTKHSAYVAIPVGFLLTFISAYVAAAVIAFIKGKGLLLLEKCKKGKNAK